jgi:Protein of unknown function (DUF1524)
VAPMLRRVARLLAPLLLVPVTVVAAATGSPSPAAADVDDVLDVLDELVVAPEGSSSGYSRDEFPHWIDNNGDCEDTRDEVLAWESTVTVGWDAAGCNVVSGSWWSAYDGRTLTDPSDVQIDHFIPLAEAWRSGASGWTRAERQAFANDLAHEETLRAVSGSSNASKGDRDPDEWLPADASFHCQYLIDWVTVKTTWDLTVEQAEYDALASGLAPCGV